MSLHWGPPPWKLLTQRHCTWKQLVVLWPIFSWLNLAGWPKSFYFGTFFYKRILLEVKSLKRPFLRKSRHISLLGSWHVALKMWRMLKRFLLHILFIAKFSWFFLEMIANSSTSEKRRKKEEKTGCQCPLLIFMLDSTFPQTTQT